MITIRSECEPDIPAIRRIHIAAFPTEAEADLVDKLRLRGKLEVSLISENESGAIGHIGFSRVILQEQPELYGLGLAPMSVIPEKQRQGIGSSLVRQGLERCSNLGARFVVVLGHPQFYPRFGFRSASHYGVTCEWQVPDDVFLVLEMQTGILAGINGMVRYEPEFHEL